MSVTTTGRPGFRVRTVTENYEFDRDDAVVIANANSLTISLPPANAAHVGKLYVVKTGSSITGTTVSPVSGTINGASTYTALTEGQLSAGFISDGVNWQAHAQTVPGHLLSSGSAPTAAAGSNAGTSPPAPVVDTSSTDARGGLTFGTGTTPAAGNQAVVTFNTAYAAAPIVMLTARKANTAALALYATSVSTTGFTIGTNSAPSAGQANTTYSVAWQVVG